MTLYIVILGFLQDINVLIVETFRAVHVLEFEKMIGLVHIVAAQHVIGIQSAKHMCNILNYT